MSYKNVTLISFWIFSASYMVPVLGMHNNNQSRSATIVKEASKLPQKAHRKVLKNQQPHENSITNVAATVKALSSSLENIRVRKTKKPLQQEQNLPQQKQPKERQKQLKLQQSPQQKQTAQPQQQQQKTPQQQLQQKTNIKRTHDVNNIIQGEQSQQPRNRNFSRGSKKSQTIYNAATILAVASNVVHAEHVQGPHQQNKKKNVQVLQSTAVVGQNGNSKKAQQQLGGNKSQNIRSGQQKAHNTVPVQSQKDQPEIIHSKDSVHIYDPADKSEVIVFKDCKDILSPGVYYRSEDGLMPVPKDLRSNNGKRMVKNHLSQLTPLNDFVCQKTDLHHSFSQYVEKECGDYARVVIKNVKNCPDQIKENDKKFDLYVTMPGVINKIDYAKTGEKIVTQENKGVFEFTVRKTLYEREGQCMHRFLAPKGMVGAEGFGAKAHNKRIAL